MNVRPVTFRLYPEKGARYIRVHVWPTKKAMQEHLRTSWHLGRCGAAATCASFTMQKLRKGRWRTLPIVAEVNMYRARLGTSIITHEFLHAAIAFARRIQFDFTRLDADDSVNGEEERLCYVHGNLCRDFVDRAHAAGLYS